MDTNTVITNWKNGTTEFECISPNGVKTVLGTSTENNKIIDKITRENPEFSVEEVINRALRNL